MIRILSESEIEGMLSGGFAGRLGCSADGRSYVVPIAYAYHSGFVYSHSDEGLKIRLMRKNPNVCFEIDDIADELNWRSVIAWGRFEELHGEAAEEAMRIILLKFLPAKARREPDALPAGRPGVGELGAVIYRIRLTERTGRIQGRGQVLHEFFHQPA